MRQAETIGDEIEVISHLDPTVVAGIVHASGMTETQRSDRHARQIIGVNMISIRIVCGMQRRNTGEQPLERQPFARVNTRSAQYRHADAAALSPCAQLTLCVEATPRAF